MAFAALTSLQHTMSRVIYDPKDESLELLHLQMFAIMDIWEDISGNSKGLETSDAQIMDEVHKFEDALESHWRHKILSQSEDLGYPRDDRILFEDVRELFESFKEATEKIMFPVNESKNTSALEEEDEEDEEEEEDLDSTTFGFEGNKPQRVRFFNDKLTIVGPPLEEWRARENPDVFTLVGMAGTGRTILASSVFNDPAICNYFDRRVWVTVGPNCQYKEIVKSILAQIDPQGSHDSLLREGEKGIYYYLHERMKGRMRCLIVLDDVKDSSDLRFFLGDRPAWGSGYKFLLTLREEIRGFRRVLNIYALRVLSKEESWDLLCKLVFDPQLCPPELVKAGKKIAANCKGLAVEIAKTALSLSSTEKTPEHWDKVAAEMETFLSEDEYDEMSEISKTVTCSNSTGSARMITKLLGLSYAINYVKMNLISISSKPKTDITSFLGMAGIGKTFHAKRIFEDRSSNFDCRVWVTVGRKGRLDIILGDIIAQIDDNENKRSKGDEQISTNRCLIVLDDLWSKTPLLYLRYLPLCFMYEIWLTTRLEKVANFTGTCRKIPLLKKEESWSLLCKQVFAENSCPRELREAGKVIAENCDGLPLLIVTVARILSEAEKTLEYWKKVAKRRSEVFEKAYDKIMKVLLRSYLNLPLYLRPIFLYLGTFHQNYEIRLSRLFRLYYCDQILDTKANEHDFVAQVKMLISDSLFLVVEEKYSSQIKTCRLHLVFWNMCIREARKIKFFHVLNSSADGKNQDMEKQRRLCIQNSVLFALKDVHKSIASISDTRSLLCTSPPHRYPVPICYRLQFLRVLNALSIRLYKFPLEVLNLVLLRLLALTCDEELPPSIYKLKKLECLIVHRHMCIRMCGAPSCLPMEIQRMIELEHLQIMGSTLPDHCGGDLKKLKVLLDVIANHSTKSFLQCTPKVKKLGIRIEVFPDAFEPLFCFGHISHLTSLESFKCVVVNPNFEFKFPPPASLRDIPTSLVKLSLSGFGYPWKSIKYIASHLNVLKELKLRSYAFRGLEWIMYETDFKSLEYLLLEDTDLECWRVDGKYCHMKLRCLTIRHCYKLKGIPPQCEIDEIKVVPAEMETLSTDYLNS